MGVFPNSGLQPAERERVERLGGAIYTILIEEGMRSCPSWRVREAAGRRIIVFGIFAIDADVFAVISDEELLAQLRKAFLHV